VPNWASAARRLFGTPTDGYDFPRHRQVFITPGSLRAALDPYGLLGSIADGRLSDELIDLQRSSRMECFESTGSGPRSWSRSPQLGPRCLVIVSTALWQASTVIYAYAEAVTQCVSAWSRAHRRRGVSMAKTDSRTAGGRCGSDGRDAHARQDRLRSVSFRGGPPGTRAMVATKHASSARALATTVASSTSSISRMPASRSSLARNPAAIVGTMNDYFYRITGC